MSETNQGILIAALVTVVAVVGMVVLYSGGGNTGAAIGTLSKGPILGPKGVCDPNGQIRCAQAVDSCYVFPKPYYRPPNSGQPCGYIKQYRCDKVYGGWSAVMPVKLYTDAACTKVGYPK